LDNNNLKNGKLFALAPLFPVALVCILAAAAGAKAQPGSLITAGIVLAAALVGLLIKRARSVFALIICAAVMFAGACMRVTDWYRIDAPAKEGMLSGTVYGRMQVKDEYLRVVLEDAELDGKPLGGNVQLTLFLTDQTVPDIREGMGVSLQAALQRPASAKYSGGYDQRFSLMIKGIEYTAAEHVSAITVNTGSVNESLFTKVRTKAQALCEEYIGGESGELTYALLTGDSSVLPEDEVEAFRSLGIAHVLAVSGLHIGVLLSAVGFVCGKRKMRFRVPHLLYLVMCVLLLGAYVVLSNASVSIIRAVGMWLLTTCFLLWRRQQPLNVLSIMAIVSVVSEPLQVYNVSFILSYLCTFGIIVLYQPLYEGLKLLRFTCLRSAVAASLSATVVVFPASILLFGEFPLLSLVGNLLLTFPAAALVVAAVAFAVMGFCGILPLAGLTGRGLDFVSGWYLKIVGICRDYSPMLKLPPPGTASLLLAAGGIILAVIVKGINRKGRRILAALMLIASAGIYTCQLVSHSSGAAAISNGSAVSLALWQEDKAAIVMYDECYGMDRFVLSKANAKVHAVVSLSENAYKAMEEIKEYAGETAEVYVPQAVAEEYIMAADLLQMSVDIRQMAAGETFAIAGYSAKLVNFYAASADAKTRYALSLDINGENVLYIDPMYIARGEPMGIKWDVAVCADWSKLRYEGACRLKAHKLIYSSPTQYSWQEQDLLPEESFELNALGSIPIG